MKVLRRRRGLQLFAPRRPRTDEMDGAGETCRGVFENKLSTSGQLEQIPL
jgi:hypothetical protein